MRKRKKSRPFLILWGLPILITMIVTLLVQVSVIREIRVVGARNIDRNTIIELSGVKPGDISFLLSNAKIRRGIESDYYLQYEGRRYDYKGALTLHVKERSGMGFVRLMGIRYVLDTDGVVLEYTAKESDGPAMGPEIFGLSLKNGVSPVIGERFPVQDETQLEIMRDVLQALNDVNLLVRVKDVDFTAPDDIVVDTKEGAGIHLGENQDLVLKLAIAREVLQIYKEEPQALKGATIDVANGREAHFIPRILPTITPQPTPTPMPTPTPTPEPGA